MKSIKLPMEKRKSQKEISVTFTKRRQVLFNKAAELSTFCDAQIASLFPPPVNGKFTPSATLLSLLFSALFCVILRRFRIRISAGDGDNLTVEEAISVLDDFQKSESVEELSFLVEELGKLVDRAKRKPNYGCGTSNSAPVAGNFLFSCNGNYDCGKSNSDLQDLFLCPIADNFAFAGNVNGPIVDPDLNSGPVAGKFGDLVEGWGKLGDFANRNPNYECGTRKLDLQGFFLPPYGNPISGDFVSDSTVSQAISVDDDSEKSDLSFFVQAIKRNSNYNYRTSNSDLQVHSNSCSDFNCNGTFNSGDGLFGIVQESASLVKGNYSIDYNLLGSSESINCVPNFEVSNRFGSCATEGSSKSVMEEDKRWSFKEDDNGLLVASDYKDSNIEFVDY